MELQRDLQGADAIFTNLAKNNRVSLNTPNWSK